MSKLSRTKGHSFERAIARKFKSLFPEAMRKLEYNKEDIDGRDIKNTGKLAIQCKALKKYSPLTAIEEITAKGYINMLVTKGDRKPPIVALYLDDFLKILEDPGVIHGNK